MVRICDAVLLVEGVSDGVDLLLDDCVSTKVATALALVELRVVAVSVELGESEALEVTVAVDGGEPFCVGVSEPLSVQIDVGVCEGEDAELDDVVTDHRARRGAARTTSTTRRHVLRRRRILRCGLRRRHSLARRRGACTGLCRRGRYLRVKAQTGRPLDKAALQVARYVLQCCGRANYSYAAPLVRA